MRGCDSEELADGLSGDEDLVEDDGNVELVDQTTRTRELSRKLLEIVDSVRNGKKCDEAMHSLSPPFYFRE
eukprot:CAMPEP_0184685842 /NCGR_PEP_ID=MMETSP0312-20130426/20409_1 /TAXON_ID=31354 /ORGANISM="Compsopogon coeruleus, Strain SAG 36.94" /LENGTH=70 /DNA_ID=CAMNT_0027140333 /DNA_START=70 /DNA_END=282 /DNA_ORIENTATION=-